MDQLIRDFIAVKHYERQIGRKLTEEEINGFKPFIVITDDGVRASIYIEKIPLSFFFPTGSER
jgi:hypothetical protein